MEYIIDDRQLDAAKFIAFVNKVWPGNYDEEKTSVALSKTINITAYHDGMLVGCLRILTDGYYFGTITELLVLPDYQKRGIGSKLLQRISLSHLLANHGLFLASQFLHLCFNFGEIALLDHLAVLQQHVIEEAILDSRSETELDARIEFLQGLCQQVG